MTSILEALRATLSALLDSTTVAYDGPEDEVGHCIHCGEISYRDCAPSCILPQARAMLARAEGVTLDTLPRFTPADCTPTMERDASGDYFRVCDVEAMLGVGHE